MKCMLNDIIFLNDTDVGKGGYLKMGTNKQTGQAVFLACVSLEGPILCWGAVIRFMQSGGRMLGSWRINDVENGHIYICDTDIYM